MRIFWYELNLIKIDILKIVFINTFFPILSTLLLLNADRFINGYSLPKAFLIIFGSIQNFNWMYWVMFGFGYVVLLQVLWKPQNLYLQQTILVSHRKIELFWLNKIAISFLFTMIYVLLYYFLAFILFISVGIEFKMDFSILEQFILILVNLCVHMLIWLLLKIKISTMIANIVLATILFGGVKISKPILLFYYGMIQNFDKDILFTIFFIECGVVFILCQIILQVGKKMDY